MGEAGFASGSQDELIGAVSMPFGLRISEVGYSRVSDSGRESECGSPIWGDLGVETAVCPPE